MLGSSDGHRLRWQAYRTRNTAMLHENVYSKAGTGRDRFRQ